MSTLPYVVSFGQVDEYDRESIGEYALGIVELHREGFPVPQGFIVTQTAYDTFLREHGTEKVISEVLAEIDNETPDSAGEAYARIASFMQTRSMPREIVMAVHEAYLRGLARDKKGSVVLRDREGSVEILGENDLTEKIKAGWAREFWRRELAKEQRLHHGMGLVVQKIPLRDYSGVGFIEKDKSRIVVLVENGDKYVFDSQDFDLIESQQSEPEDVGETIKELAQKIDRICQHYYFPKEIDWIISGGNIFFLGTREFFDFPELKPELSGKKKKIKSEKYSKKLSEARVRTVTRVWVALEKFKNIDKLHVDGILFTKDSKTKKNEIELPTAWLHSERVFYAKTPENIINLDDYLEGKEMVVVDIDKTVRLALGRKQEDFGQMPFPEAISQWLISRAVKKAQERGIKIFLYGQRLVLYDELVEISVRLGVSGFAVEERNLERIRRIVYDTEREMIR